MFEFLYQDEPAVINHPLSCYKSRIFDYTVKLNEILNQDELSSNKTGLTKELESCRVSSISELEGNSPISDNNKTELTEDLGSYKITNKYYNKTELTEDM
ncbi:2689_t:CDS:2, partial [Funneliformis caledonium]